MMDHINDIEDLYKSNLHCMSHTVTKLESVKSVKSVIGEKQV